MPSTYNNNLRIEIIGSGEQSGVWGSTTNNNLGTLIVDAITGIASVTTSVSPYTLTALNGAADESRCSTLQLSTTTGANFIVIVPTVSKLYVVRNVDPTYSVNVKTASGLGTIVPAGKTCLLRCNGTDVVEQLDHVVNNFSLGGALEVTGASTFTGAVSAPAGVTGPLTGSVTGNVAGNLSGNVTGNVAVGAGTITTTNFTITETGGILIIKHGSTNIAKIDSSGNITVIGNVTGFGTI